MKQLVLVFVVLILVPWWAVSASADPLSGDELQQLCLGTGEGEANADVAKHKACIGFLGSVSDPPPWASMEMLRRLWLSYARRYPQELSWDAATVTTNAFNDAFAIDYE